MVLYNACKRVIVSRLIFGVQFSRVTSPILFCIVFVVHVAYNVHSYDLSKATTENKYT